MDIQKAIRLLTEHYVWVDSQGKFAKHITKESALEIADMLRELLAIKTREEETK